MKANEAPEKIYLQENTTTDCYGEFWPEWFEARAKDDDIEYTRTNAFIEKEDFDWQSFRNQAAKDILCATLSGGTAYGMNDIVSKKETIVKASIEIADELIKQLK